MKDPQELKTLLGGFTGSQEVFRHALTRAFVYTEGMRALFHNAGNGAYWLADILATDTRIARGVRSHGFCVCVLNVSGTKALLTAARDGRAQEDGHGNVTGYQFMDSFFERQIDYTDFPEGVWKFYLTHTEIEGRGVCMALLPSEY